MINRTVGPLTVIVSLIVTLILVSLPRDSGMGMHVNQSEDHAVSGSDFGDEVGHHHHNHVHDEGHDARIFGLVPELGADWMHVWRVMILFSNVVALTAGVIAICVLYLASNRPRLRASISSFKSVSGKQD